MKYVKMLVLCILACVTMLQAQGDSWQIKVDRADSLKSTRNYDSAITIYNSVLKNVDLESNLVDTIIFSVLNNLGNCYGRIRQYDQAKSVFERLLLRQRRTYGEASEYTAKTLYNLAKSYGSSRQLDSAVAFASKSLEILVKIHGSTHREISKVTYGLGNYYLDMGKPKEAETVLLWCLDIRQKLYGRKHKYTTTAMNRLGVSLRRQGRYNEAINMFQEVLSIREEVLGTEDRKVALVLNNLALVYYTQRKFGEAEKLFKRAISINEKVLGKDNPKVAIGLNNLANLYDLQGRLAEAESLHLRALQIRENAFGKNHADVAQSMANLAIIYTTLRKYDKAESILLQVIEVRENILRLGHPDIAESLNSLGNLYMKQRKFSEAEKLYERALSIWEESLGSNNDQTAICMNNLANANQNQKKFEKAEKLYEKAIGIWREILGDVHPEIARVLTNLAGIYVKRGEFQIADSLYCHAMIIREETLPAYHYDIAKGYEKYAEFLVMWDRRPQTLALQDNHQRVLHYFKRAIDIRKRNYMQNWMVLSEADAIEYARLVRKAVEKYLSCFFDHSYDTINDYREIADIVLATKGIVSDGIFRRQKSIATESDSITVKLLGALKDAKFQISKLYVRGPGKDMVEYRNKIDSLTIAVDNLDAELSRFSASYNLQKEQEDVTSNILSRQLPDQSILVEYMKYEHRIWDKDSTIPCYLAVVIDSKDKPIAVRLSQASSVDSLVRKYRDHMITIANSGSPPTSDDVDLYKAICSPITNLVIKPIKKFLPENNLLILATDGTLNQISFAGLLANDNEYLIEKYDVHYLSAARDVLRLAEKRAPVSGLLALGHPDYDAAAVARLSAMDNPSEYVDAENSGNSNELRSTHGVLSRIQAESIPATYNEVKTIIEGWQSVSQEQAELYFGAAASEDMLKIKAPGKRIIHLATHGYYINSVDYADYNQDDLNYTYSLSIENPLLLSGLLLAGANHHGKDAVDNGIEDGFLSALEVSAMKLEGTNLVVLSACETGIGALESGEGVYGLRRAFLIAGARSVLCTLWQVSDWATADIMKRFYKSKHTNLYVSLNEAQRNRLSKMRLKGQPDHPYNWAAFIAIGDW
jgi:tetratricopeptide (TPR) repeat protein/CHAT domain-containing protein